MLGLNDTVTIKTKVRASDGRGGSTTTYTTKIASLICSLQPIRREELSFDIEGLEIINPYLLTYENLSDGLSVDPDDLVTHSTGNYIVITSGTITGLGTHTETVLRKASSGAEAY